MNKELYLEEMKSLISNAIDKLKTKDNFKVYTVSIWTDPNAGASAISFDSEENSKLKIEKSNEWSKKHYERLIAAGDFQEAEMFKPNVGRNTNPTDFELRDLVEVSHQSFPQNWEEDTEGECWNELQPLLIEVGNLAFESLQVLNLHQEFELAVNGPEDWYEYTWKEE